MQITHKEIFSNLRQPAGYVLAYGSFRIPFNRRLKPEVTRSTIRCQNLFFQDTSLIDYNGWLCSLNETHFNRVAIALKELMSLDEKDILVRNKRLKKILVLTGNKQIPIDLYSDGYRSVFAMACDIMEKLVKEETHIAVAEGVVLIDELGTHLHPRWRMMVVSKLRSVFPKIQFITTTHDPLCLKGTKKGEVMVMKLDPRTKETVLLKDLPDPAPMRADQLLASEFFGLSSTIDPETEEKFNTYYFLLAKKETEDLSTAENRKFQQLQKELDEWKGVGESLRENLMLEALDKAVIQTSFTKDAETRLNIKQSTINQLADLLNE